ncbi:MAG TPA: DUF6537 domain-containing protein, partial [Roseiarcus sp.]|nr:DUF6537 domain-containing protein [Roseiarcus sp.]
NMFMLGFAYQAGHVPLSAAALCRAIELNGEAVALNLSAFAWGRAAFADPQAVGAVIDPKIQAMSDRQETLEDVVARRAEFLTAYQNAAYSGRYRTLVGRVAEAERKRAPAANGLALAVARNLFKLMAYKDEYEVARLYADGSFQRQVAEAFDGPLRFEFHLAPPLLARRDKSTGELRKMSFGPWMMHGFKALAAARILRGTPFDPFGYANERRRERQLIADYEDFCEQAIVGLTSANHAVALALAALPEKIRGYGHVKERSIVAAAAERERLLAFWGPSGAPMERAAE